MSQVSTVRGPVDGGLLGRTLMHEHIFVLSPEIEKTAEEWDESAQRASAVTKLRELKQHGIDTYNDVPMYFHFTGPGTVLGGPEPMVDLFVREIVDGIGGTGVRAGILK